jgi:LysM repeat protein
LGAKSLAMTTHLPTRPALFSLSLLALSAGLLTTPAHGHTYPVTPAQKATAQQVAQAGVPLSALAPDAPDEYTVQPGDTLWAIASLFLRSPWRWPELWGMNLAQIKNPHLIYPGQQLFLEKLDGQARLRLGGSALAGAAAGLPTVRLSPRTRQEPLGQALTTLQANAIDPFLAEPLIVEEHELAAAPRIVATQEHRVLLTRGDRAYARGPLEAPLLDGANAPRQFRIFRQATPLKDPVSGEVLGFEAQYVGKAALLRGESSQDTEEANGQRLNLPVPASLDIVAAKEEMRVGDRLLPEPERQFLSYSPRAPQAPVDARIVSVYGSAVVNAAQNQVVAINRGRRDGLESGHVLAILKDGRRLADPTDPDRTRIKLPDERNGLLMVFRTFERLSYGLVLDITDSVHIGDRLSNPR